jgi:hypothetical protein
MLTKEVRQEVKRQLQKVSFSYVFPLSAFILQFFKVTFNPRYMEKKQAYSTYVKIRLYKTRKPLQIRKI